VDKIGIPALLALESDETAWGMYIYIHERETYYINRTRNLMYNIS